MVGGYCFVGGEEQMKVLAKLFERASRMWDKWRTKLDMFDPDSDTTSLFGMTMIDFKGNERALEYLKKVPCENCLALYNPEDYLQEAPEWLCSQCGKTLPKKNPT